MRAVFIGDEVTAAAYRLGGLDIRVGAPEQAVRLLAAARREARPLILITAECAAAVPAAVLDEALSAFAPPVVLVPDAAARVAVPDLVTRITATLGLGA